MRSWRTIGHRELFAHPLLRAEALRLRSPEDGAEREAISLCAPDWVNVVAIDSIGRVLMVRQWRFAIAARTLEVPGGIVDPGEDDRRAAERELLEETGYRARTWTRLGEVHPNPAILTNRCPTWLATDLERVSEPHGDGEEELELELVELERIPDLIRGGEISHALVIAAFHFFDLARQRAGGSLPRRSS